MKKLVPALLFICLFVCSLHCHACEEQKLPPMVKIVLDETKPLEFPRGKRLPLYVWATMDTVGKDDAQTEEIIRQLDERGIALVSTWDYNHKWQSLSRASHVAAIQKKLGLEVSINATPSTYSFFNGDPCTAHIAADGKPFFDLSFGGTKIGCPFAVESRYPEMRRKIEFFANAYKALGLPVDFVFTDWEIDGPIEWNGAWEASKRCKRCREHIKSINNFMEFQKTLRTIRSEMQRETFADTMKSYFPDVLVGNYAVYPNDGYRYWYDYFEEPVQDGMPYKTDQMAKYRQWFDEFPLTGYTYAMPVVYTWYQTFNWYNFENPDYHWFYNLLLNATNACKNTPSNIPVISFVHWHTTCAPARPDPRVKQFSEKKYQELLWHMLLRGTDGLYLWCPADETAKEVRLLHGVYAASLEYKEFLDKGTPICFDVPNWQGPVVSGLQLGGKVLVRRTDFDDTTAPVELQVGDQLISIPRVEGKCQVIDLGQ